jgi:hypothetical protein
MYIWIHNLPTYLFSRPNFFVTLQSCQYVAHTASNFRMINERWIGKDLEGAAVACSRYHPGTGVEELRKATKIFSQDRGCPSRDSNRILPERELYSLTATPTRSVYWFVSCETTRSRSNNHYMNIPFPASSRPALGSTQPPIQWHRG